MGWQCKCFTIVIGEGTHTPQHMWRSEVAFVALALFFHHVASRDQLGSKHLSSHLDGWEHEAWCCDGGRGLRCPLQHQVSFFFRLQRGVLVSKDRD